MLALAHSGDPRAASAIEDYLDDRDSFTRCAAAFALAFVDSPVSAALLDSLSDSEVWVRKAAAFTLGWRRDPRAVDALIQMLRDESLVNSRRFTGSRFEEYSANLAAFLPQSSYDVTSLHPVVTESLLVGLGAAARRALETALKHGGPMNESLCGPLAQLGWTPSDATEEFFSFLVDRDRTYAERQKACDELTMLSTYRPEDISASTLTRSVRGSGGSHDVHLRASITGLVAKGVVPLWREVAGATYSDEEKAALRECLKEILQRHGSIVTPDAREGIESALA